MEERRGEEGGVGRRGVEKGRGEDKSEADMREMTGGGELCAGCLERQWMHRAAGETERHPLVSVVFHNVHSSPRQLTCCIG